MLSTIATLALLASARVAVAANAKEWSTRQIYQYVWCPRQESSRTEAALAAERWINVLMARLFTDRFAPPSATAPARTTPLPEDCDPGLQTWCGGTWLSIIDRLDYIQNMGFDAIWISPTSENIDVWTPYNYAYHGYWVTDPRKINLRFGSADDLKLLSKTLHDRGMYLMVDVVINNVPGLHWEDSLSADTLKSSGLIWDDPAYFHPHCWIDYSNNTSVEYCSLGDNNLALMDVNTEHPHVISTLEDWIVDYVAEFQIDGLRIDAAKHVPGPFWTSFCGKAGVFCIGEVFGDDLPFAASFQTNKYMDSVLGFPYYNGLVRGFGTPFGNMSGYVETHNAVLKAFPNPDVIGNFIENHDLPRWRNQTVDPQLGWNAMVAQYLFNGIPTVYYGQEQDFQLGAGDPYNRAALWPSKYANSTTYNRITRLNTIRHALITNSTAFNGQNFHDARAEIVGSSASDVAIRRGPALAILTNRGSPPSDGGFSIQSSGWPAQTSLVDVLSCRTMSVASGGGIAVSYSAPGSGGMPYLFMSAADVKSLKLCDQGGIVQTSNSTQLAPLANGAGSAIASTSILSGIACAAILAAVMAL